MPDFGFSLCLVLFCAPERVLYHFTGAGVSTRPAEDALSVSHGTVLHHFVHVQAHGADLCALFALDTSGFVG